MKPKSIVIYIFFLFLSISGMLINVYAINYKVGISENEEIIWHCRVSNNNELEFIFGIGWDDSGIFTNLSRGAKMKWKITTTEINESIKIEYNIWYWTLNENWGNKDGDKNITYHVNPTDYLKPLNFSGERSFVPFWFPVPVREYIGNLKLHLWYDVDSRVLATLNVFIPKDNIFLGYPNKDIKIIAIYNEQGLLSSYKLYGKDNTVIIDIILDSLPFYVIPSLVGFFTAILIGIVLYIRKKRNINILRKE